MRWTLSIRRGAKVAQAVALALSWSASMPVLAQMVQFDVPEEDAASAIQEFARQANLQIIAQADKLRGIKTHAVRGTLDTRIALKQLLDGTGIIVASDDGHLISLRVAKSSPDPPASQPPADPAGPIEVRDEEKPPEAAALVEEVVVTATRVDRQGYSAPTPTTVLGIDQIQSQAPANLADVINELPALSSSNTNRTQNAAGVSVQGQGMNLLNLRDLGPNRTLVLLDGARAVPSNATLNVDINLLPTELVKRVDVVTGGASADWGSDAVAGVVNFILDKDFVGLKGFLQGGESGYSDGQNLQTGLTYGTALLDGRAHFEISAKYSDQMQVGGAVPSGRTWYGGWKVLGNPNGTATDILLPNVGLSSATDGGLITAGGALKGTQFVGAAGTPAPFKFGFVSGQESVNGSAEDDGGRIQLENPEQEGNVFARFSYDLNDHVTAYTEASYAHSNLTMQSVPYNRLGNITITSGNPYIPASVQAIMTADKIASFTLGKVNQQLGFTLLNNDTQVGNIKAGLSGRFGTGWSWDGYYQHGQNDTLAKTHNDGIIPNYNAAVDAVTNPSTGAIVCRTSLANPSNGCIAFNPFGTAPVTAAQEAYLTGTGFQRTDLTQDDVAADVRGTPFSTWAGPVSVAAGLEYRRESYSVNTDALSQANDFFINYGTPASGQDSVAEGFIETVAPLLADVPLVKSLDFNSAVRVADYSYGGVAPTWKFGFTYAPVNDIRFRTTRSRDIRAPNLQDLFATGVTTQSALIDPVKGTSYQISQITAGSRNLTPEVADTTSGGFVIQPHAVPGLSASLDYFSIAINNAITTPAAQVILNQCAAGDAQACLSVTRSPTTGLITSLAIAPLNIQAETTAGFDFAVNYQRALDTLNSHLAGVVTFQALATETFDHTVNLLGTAIQYAGTNGDGVYADPRWRGEVSTSYALGRFSGSFIVQYIGSGAISNKTPIIVNNTVPSIAYLDLSGSYKLASGFEIYGVIDNIFNQSPPPSPQVTTTPHLNVGVNSYVYDTIGRQFRIGFRFKL